jgi:hypothetical protein
VFLFFQRDAVLFERHIGDALCRQPDFGNTVRSLSLAYVRYDPLCRTMGHIYPKIDLGNKGISEHFYQNDKPFYERSLASKLKSAFGFGRG